MKKTPEQANEAVLKARREYYRQWRAKNKERVKEYNNRYWLKRAGQASGEEHKDGECNDQ